MTSRKAGPATLGREVLHALPKSDLHVHLDGSLRLHTLIDLAKEQGVPLPSATEEGLLELVFKRAYKNLPEYLKGFEFTVACLQDADALERVAYELCHDCRRGMGLAGAIGVVRTAAGVQRLLQHWFSRAQPGRSPY